MQQLPKVKNIKMKRIGKDEVLERRFLRPIRKKLDQKGSSEYNYSGIGSGFLSGLGGV